jgi:hypothetical protein
VEPYWKYAVVLRPFGFTVPFNVAVVGPRLFAPLVKVIGAPDVVCDDVVPSGVGAGSGVGVGVGVGAGHALVTNETSPPVLAPAELFAAARKWYVVPHANPDKLPLLIGTTAVPADTLTLWVVCP